MSEQEVTNAVLALKIDNLAALVKQHLDDDAARFDVISDTMHGVDNKPGLLTRLDRLEQSDKSRKWIVTVLGGSLAVQLWQWIAGGVRY